MSTPTDQRPPQVTLASTIVMVASALVLLSAWERIAGLGSLETQEAVRDLLGRAPYDQLSANGVTTTMRVGGMVAAAAACATGILGWYVRKPDRSARLWLSVFAVPVVVGGLVSTLPVGVSLSEPFVAAGVAMLWLVPAREWFATGRWTPPKPVEKPDTSRRTTPGGAAGPTDPRAPLTPPPASRPFGEAPPPQQNPYGQPWTPPQDQTQQWQQGQVPPPLPPGYPPPPGWQPHPVAPPRPQALVTAFVITVVTAGGLLAIALMFLGVAANSVDLLMTELERQQPDLMDNGITADEMRSMLIGSGIGFLVWSTVALVLAGFTMARREWARRGLLVSAACSAVGCIVAALASPVVLIPAAAAIATVVCLRRVEVRQWFSLGVR